MLVYVSIGKLLKLIIFSTGNVDELLPVGVVCVGTSQTDWVMPVTVYECSRRFVFVLLPGQLSPRL